MAYFGGNQRSWSALTLLLALACRTTDVVSYQDGGAFVGRAGTRFVLNGSSFFFNGFNSYWMMRVAAETSERCKVSQVLSEAAAAGLTVCRTWAFSDGGDRALQVSPGLYDERVFQGLDFVISEAQSYGVRLILSLVNNYDDFGGKKKYVEWAGRAGISVSKEDDFYTNPVVKGYYKNHIRTVLTRYNTITKKAYRDDPTIMAWELMNEPRCQADRSGKTVNAWVQEMATYTKSLDSRHILGIGMEGFYGDSMPEKNQYNPGYKVGTDFISSNLIKEIDFATIHAYPDIWFPGQSEGSQMSFMQRWMWSHWDDSRRILKKPLVFAEFGKSKKDQGYSEDGRDRLLDTIYSNIYNYTRTGGVFAGGLVWQLMAEGMESYYDGYEIVLSRDNMTTGVITRQSHAMSVLAHTMSRPAGGPMDRPSYGGHGRRARSQPDGHEHRKHGQPRHKRVKKEAWAWHP